MLRSREIKWFLSILTAVTAAAAGIGFAHSVFAGCLALGAALLLDVLFWIFTAWRYRELRKLSQQLIELCRGGGALNIRDNREGELSALKNNLYKVITMLSEQSKQAMRGRNGLADALSDVSHQLKTPLTSMMMLGEFLRQDDLNPAQRREFSRQLQNQLERLEWLVTSLLKLSKIDAGTALFKQERISAAALVERATAPLLIPMDLKNQTLVVTGGQALLEVDGNWTAEAVTNVVKNCIEHTPEGGKVSISWEENPLYMTIRVADNGEGIAKRDLPYVFQRFYKGQNASPDSVGIGLAMAQSIVQAQCGDLSVESEAGKGSCFTFTFYHRRDRRPT